MSPFSTDCRSTLRWTLYLNANLDHASNLLNAIRCALLLYYLVNKHVHLIHTALMICSHRAGCWRCSPFRSYTQAKSPHVNFTWNEFHMNFTWNVHVNFTWISREICFMWISRETVTWISRETRFTWNSCEIFHVNCRWIEFHMKFTWNMHLYFTWILWVEIYSRVSISGKKN